MFHDFLSKLTQLISGRGIAYTVIQRKATPLETGRTQAMVEMSTPMFWEKEVETATRADLDALKLRQLCRILERAARAPFYASRLPDNVVENIRPLSDT